MSAVSRFDCFPSDFLNGIVGRTADEIALYTVVLMLQYDHGGAVPLAGHEREFVVRAGLTRKRFEKALASLVALGKLHVESGVVWNSRASREIEKISEKLAKNRENSELGGISTKRKFEAIRNENKGGVGPSGWPNGWPKQGPNPPSPVPLPSATAANAAAATPPPALDDLRKACIEAAGRDFSKGFGLIVELATVHPVETRILPIIRECVADMTTRGEKAHSWAYFAEAIMDEHRAAPPAPAPLVEHVWCEKGSPEFERGNAARVARGEIPWSGFPSRHHGGSVGASFPASDVREERAQA